MTVATLLTKKINVDKAKAFTEEELLGFVNEIEAEVAEQLRVFAPTYSADDKNKKLLAPAPYDRLYISYVDSMIDKGLEETGSYQNNAAQHVQDFRDFTDWVVRTGIASPTSAYTRFRGIF